MLFRSTNNYTNMKKTIIALVLLGGIAGTAYAAFERPAVGCTLAVSSNFVQKNELVQFVYTSNAMAQLTVSRVTNTETTQLLSTATTSGSVQFPATISADYRFAFSSVDGTAVCTRSVRIPNVTNPK